MTRLLAVEAVLPEHRYGQAELADALVGVVGAHGSAERQLRRIHANCGVAHRHVALPIERYTALRDFGDANDAFIDAAVELGSGALLGALDRAGVRARDLDVIVSTTVTGLAVPSLEALVAARAGLRADVVRVPLLGLGCMGGAAGLARVHDLLGGRPDALAALLSVELCSLTVQHGDTTPANLVASGLFGDGAGAALVAGDEHAATAASVEAAGAPRIVASTSRLYPDTRDVMGWRVRSSGLQVVLGAEVPDLVHEHVGGDVRAFLAEHALAIDDVGWWVCHPGGPKVIDALVETLGVHPDALALTTASLRRVGNLSSASVLHILRDTLDERPPAPGSFGVMMAMGPGFSLELVLLRAAGDAAAGDAAPGA